MTFDDYQKKSRKTVIYPTPGKNYLFPTLGLIGEAGELANYIKKVVRDKNNKLDAETRLVLVKELGDVLWYMAQLCKEMKISFSDLASQNLEKVLSRLKRGTLHGSGDNR